MQVDRERVTLLCICFYEFSTTRPRARLSKKNGHSVTVIPLNRAPKLEYLRVSVSSKNPGLRDTSTQQKQGVFGALHSPKPSINLTEPSSPHSTARIMALAVRNTTQGREAEQGPRCGVLGKALFVCWQLAKDS
jgi:hypothetical protein